MSLLFWSWWVEKGAPTIGGWAHNSPPLFPMWVVWVLQVSLACDVWGNPKLWLSWESSLDHHHVYLSLRLGDDHLSYLFLLIMGMPICQLSQFSPVHKLSLFMKQGWTYNVIDSSQDQAWCSCGDAHVA